MWSIESYSNPARNIGDEYTGLDRFGRVDEQNWYNTSTSTSIVDIQYGYDDDGNVLYQNNTLESTQSELFTYDNLGQLTSYEQGTLSDDNTVIASPSITETWGYDPLGNHLTDTTNSVTITSTFNYDNQITSISSGTTPTYDADGNMTEDQSGLTYTYDAWDHEIDVYSGDTLEENYTFDGFGDRVTNTVYTDDVGATTNLYNSTSEQVLEEQAAGTGYYTNRYVWSQNYVNQMVSRDTDTSGTGLTASGDGYSRVWPVADANFNTVALVAMSDGSATVVERYAYDPFGTVTYMTGSYGSESTSAYGWVYGFQGGRLDTITCDTNFDARNENSALGTWTSEDPLGFGAGDIDLYRFIADNPQDSFDPSGLDSSWVDIGGFNINTPWNIQGKQAKVEFFQVRGTRGIGTGRWSQPAFAGTGSSDVSGETGESVLTLTGDGKAGGVCNTPVSPTVFERPSDKAWLSHAASLKAVFMNLCDGTYSVKVKYRIVFEVEKIGNMTSIVNVMTPDKDGNLTKTFQDYKQSAAAGPVDAIRSDSVTVTSVVSGGLGDIVGMRLTMAGITGVIKTDLKTTVLSNSITKVS